MYEQKHVDILQYENRMIWLKFEKRDNFLCFGQIGHPYLERTIIFNDYEEMLIVIQKFLDGEFDDDYVSCSNTFQLMMKEIQENEDTKKYHWCKILLNEKVPFSWSGKIWVQDSGKAMEFYGTRQLMNLIKRM